MSTVQEIKSAASKLTTQERADLLNWLAAEEQQAASGRLDQCRREWAKLSAQAHAVIGPVTWTRGDLYAR